MKRLINICLWFLLIFAAQVRAAPMLTGDVSFDDATNLYTYTYTLDTSHYEGNITEILIHQNLGFNFYDPLPVSHSEPDNWMFVLLVGSGSGDGSMEGSFWGWWKDFGTNNELATFSFTTERGINTSQNNNYALFNSSYPYPPSGFIEVGHIVGPELVLVNPDPDPVSPVPENETYAMLLAGFGIVGFMARRNTKHRGNTKIV